MCVWQTATRSETSREFGGLLAAGRFRYVLVACLIVVRLGAGETASSVAAGFPPDYEERLKALGRAMSRGDYGESIKGSLALSQAFINVGQRLDGEAAAVALAGCEAFSQTGVMFLDEGAYPIGFYRRELDRLRQRIPAGPLKERVSLWYGRALAACGDGAGAAKVFDRAGVIRDWYLVGPFDNERGAGYARAFGPEELAAPGEARKVDLDAKYQGKKAEVTWRRVRAGSFDGALDLRELLRPMEWSACYVITWFDAPLSGEYTLSTASDDGLRLWVDRREVVSREVRRPLRYGQDQVVLKLKAGRHVILAKVLQEEGEWRFQARLRAAGERGRPGPAFAEGDAPDDAGEPPAADAVQPLAGDPLAGLRDVLERVYEVKGGGWIHIGEDVLEEGDVGSLLAKKGVKAGTPGEFFKGATAEEAAGVLGDAVERVSRLEAASLHLFEGAILHGRFDHDVYKEFPHRDAFRKAAGMMEAAETRALHPLFLYFQGRSEYPVARMEAEKDYNPYVQTLGRVLEMDPSNAFVLEMLIRHYGEVRELGRVEDYLGRMPREAEAGALMRAYYDLWKRWDWKAVEDLRPYADSLYMPGVLTLAGRYRTEQRLAEAAGLLRRLCSLAYTESAVVGAYFDLLVLQGDYRRAEELVRTAAGLRPLDSNVFKGRLRLLEGEADYRSASALARDRLAVVPQEAGLHELRGRYLALNRMKEDSLVSFRKALDIEPNLPSVKRYLEVVSTSEDYSAPYLVGVPALAAKYRDYPNPEAHPALVLVDHMVFKVARDGLSSYTIHRAVRLLTTQGVEKYGSAPTPYHKDEETVKVLAARIYRPDGRVDEARVSSGGRVSLPNPRVGDVVEVRYRVDEVRRTFFGNHEEQIFLFGDVVPMALSEFVLIAPGDYKITYHVSNAPAGGGKPTVSNPEPGWVAYRWRHEDTPPVKYEPNMPSLTEIVPTLYVSHFADWKEFGRWYWSLIKEQHTASRALSEKVREITRDKATTHEKIRALYHFVTNDIEYVAWEFGVHGFKPYDASTILERKFGDCKDKATLLKVMLAEIGVDSQQALVRAGRPYIRQDMTLPLFRHFNHAICHVPAGKGYPEMWLDGTAQYFPFGQAPPHDCIRGTCVILEEKGGELMRIPPPKPEENVVVVNADIRFTEGGAEGLVTHMEVESEVKGQGEAVVRYWFHNAGQQRERLEEIFSRRYAAAKLNWEKFPDLADMYSACRFSYSMDLERYVRQEGDRYAAPLFRGFPRTMSYRALVTLEKRSADLVLSFHFPYRARLRYRCPDGYRFADKPGNAAAEADGCAFRLEVKEEGKDLVVEESILIAKDRAAPEAYEEFRRFLLEIDQAEAQDVVLVPAK